MNVPIGLKQTLCHAFGRLLAAAIVLLVFTAAARAGETVDFKRDVRPILSDKCFSCHGPDATHREADLRLDTLAGATADLGGYQAVLAGAPDESELIRRITSDDPDLHMPPTDSGKELSPEQTALLRRWIAEGATWARHWAYEPPLAHPTPGVTRAAWAKNWIDEFILAGLESKSLEPAPDADSVTLVRRLYFDLIGLPPDPSVVARYVDAATEENYERLVDDLLASPHFGERLAMYWLDLVRYADTVGYHGDQDHSISPYRDYVIDSFNRNLPFDQFTREQLAGDLLPECGVDQRIASGYNRLLQTSHEGGVQPKEYLAIYAADRVRNISAVWMGATLGCAQCHDHKFDPFTTKDFYAMAAFFADVDEAQHFAVGTNALPTRRPPEEVVLTRLERDELADVNRQLEERKQSLPSASADDVARVQAEIQQLESRQRGINMNKRPTMITVALEQPRTTRILARGNWLDESGPIVLPAVPEFLPGPTSDDARLTRLDLANWLVDAQDGVGGLTARVFANRTWYLCFGQGLARVLDDFGGQGEPPLQDQLLDRLALEFVASGWDIKHLLKLIVTSHAYRQSSIADPETLAVDPENRWVSRQARFRLPAEIVRDNALEISGLLVKDVGGMSVKPYQPAGYYRHLNFPPRTYHHDTDRQQWRRGVYVHWQRQFLHPTLKGLDAPTREECTARRPRSNTPLAALALLNDPSFVEAARVFAARVLRESPAESPESRLRYAFRLAVSRDPDEFEVEQLRRLYEAALEQYQDRREAAEELTQTGLAPVDKEFLPAELAAWTTVARAILNLHEVITRN